MNWDVPVGLAALFLSIVLVNSGQNMFRQRRLDVANLHVLITGGSSGIGLAIAELFCRRGANVSLLARSQSRLVAATDKLRACCGLSVAVEGFPADVTDFGQVKTAINAAKNKFGQIDIVITCAGAAHPGRFCEQDLSIFGQDMQLNYFGTLHTLKAVIPEMVERGNGRVVLLTSVCAVIGFAGYTSYAPTKYALRGLADTLRNELVGTGVKMQVAYPMDTQTPGFDEENRTKPPECHAISRISGEVNIFTPEQAAASVMKGIDRDAYNIATPDFFSNLLISCTMPSLTPRIFPMLIELVLAPVAVLASSIFRYLIDKEVWKERKKQRLFKPC